MADYEHWGFGTGPHYKVYYGFGSPAYAQIRSHRIRDLFFVIFKRKKEWRSPQVLYSAIYRKQLDTLELRNAERVSPSGTATRIRPVIGVGVADVEAYYALRRYGILYAARITNERK